MACSYSQGGYIHVQHPEHTGTQQILHFEMVSFISFFFKLKKRVAKMLNINQRPSNLDAS